MCRIDDAVAVALEGDVAAVLGDGRAHARLQQLLDGLDGLFVLRRVEFASAELSDPVCSPSVTASPER